MEQNLKELLLRDLCARLPYGVKCFEEEVDYPFKIIGFNESSLEFIYSDGYERKIEQVKPYLRPMSSMTKKEEIEISKILNYEFYINCDGGLTAEDDRHSISMMIMDNYINFLLSHYFDFRRIWDGYEEKSMIEKGLALPTPDGMYNLENK